MQKKMQDYLPHILLLLMSNRNNSEYAEPFLEAGLVTMQIVGVFHVHPD